MKQCINIPMEDKEARRRFQSEIGKNFSVIASAGAGKTTAIVNRIATIAEQDLNRLPQLVVVTYTNSAARAFKCRTRDLLLEKLSGHHPQEILTVLEQTFFGTIHSFCVRLLRNYQNEAGLPDMLDTITDQARTALWESFVAGDEVDQKIRSIPIAQQLLRFCTLPDLLALAKIMEPVSIEVQPEFPMPNLVAVQNCEVQAKIRPRQKKIIAQLQNFRDRIRDETGYLGLPVLDTGTGKLKEAAAQALDPLVDWLEQAALKVAGELALDFKRLCLNRGLLSFNDQINLCRELMKVQHVADDIRSRKLSVILDEAQDTQGPMFQTLLETVRPIGALFGSWPGSGAPPHPGTFSMVGDPRQTIYDERTGLEMYTAINFAFATGQGGELLDMNVTWRCATGVVNAVNHLFAGQHDPQNTVPYDDLLAAPNAVEGTAGFLTLNDGTEIGTGVNDLFRDECRQLAAWLASEGPTGLGLTSWPQLAILGQTHQWLDACGKELKAQGIPVSFFKPKIPFSNQPGFAWPVALLYTSFKPWDRFERIGVLRDIFCVSDVVLAWWVRSDWTDDPELLDALGMLTQFEKLVRSEQSLSIVVTKLLQESRLEERLVLLHEDLRPLEEFLRRVYEAEMSGKSLSILVEELLEALEEEAELPTAKGDGVELITCHSSKGLEWDVVIPIGIDRPQISGDNEAYPRLIKTGSSQRIVWNNQSRRTELIRAQTEAKTERMRRLLYVTLTRARKGLVIPFRDGFYTKNTKSFAALLPRQPDSLPHVQLPLLKGETFAPQQPVEFLIDSPQEAKQIPKGGPALIQPHTLAKDQERAETFQVAKSDMDIYDYGRWWHGWIENYPWLGSKLEQYSYTQHLGASPAFEDRAAKEVALFRSSPNIQEISKVGHTFRAEMPFSYAETAERWMEGVIDLVVVNSSDDVWVIDWKTNQHTKAEGDTALADQLRQQYLPQLEAYKKVIENGLQRSVARLLLYSTVLGRFV